MPVRGRTLRRAYETISKDIGGSGADRGDDRRGHPGIGQVRGSSAPAVPQAAGLDKSLSTSSYATWISDEAEVLSDQEEQQICLYNANWVARYDSLIAVATVREVSGDIADYAYALGE